jgi:hypothetical protein
MALLLVAVVGCLAAGAPAASAAGSSVAPLPATAAASTTAGERLHAAAEALVAQVRTTRYAHRWRADPATGHYEADCSYLVAQLVRTVAPQALAAVPRERGFDRPRAFRWYRFFASLERDGPRDGWTAVGTVAAARPGDILAWTNEPFDPGDNTGHVMIVASQPEPAGDRRWRVVVIDATGTPHDNDTRTGSGIGRGAIFLETDEAGRPVRVQLDSTRRAFTRPLAIGRLT